MFAGRSLLFTDCVNDAARKKERQRLKSEEWWHQQFTIPRNFLAAILLKKIFSSKLLQKKS